MGILITNTPTLSRDSKGLHSKRKGKLEAKASSTKRKLAQLCIICLGDAKQLQPQTPIKVASYC